MSPTTTFSAVTGQVTVTEVPDPAVEAPVAPVDAVVLPLVVAVLVVPLDAEVPAAMSASSPNARVATFAATRLPLAAAVCCTVVVVAVEVR
jgi:hypothetical protein